MDHLPPNSSTWRKDQKCPKPPSELLSTLTHFPTDTIRNGGFKWFSIYIFHQEKCMFEIGQQRRCNNHHLFFQEERLNQGLNNLCWDDNLGLLLVDLPFHLHNGGPAPVPDVTGCLKTYLNSWKIGTICLKTVIMWAFKWKLNHFLICCNEDDDGRLL